MWPHHFMPQQAPYAPFQPFVGWHSPAQGVQPRSLATRRVVAAPPPAAAAPAFKVPKLKTALYHRTVFTMPLPGKRKQAEITVYFDKATLETAYVCNWQAMAVLCDDDGPVIQNSLGTFLARNNHLKKVFFIPFLL